MSTINSQLGVKAEVTYGTPVTVDRFYEFLSCNMKLERGRVVGKGLRASSGRVARTDKFMPYTIGASGSVVMEVPTIGFGFWLHQMFGASSTTGPTDSNYTHTFTPGSLVGDFFTMQANKVLTTGSAQAVTWHGCKVTGWELSCDVDGWLVATINVDGEDEDTSTGLATAAYPAGFRLFSFDAASLTIEGTSVEVTNVKIAGENPMDTNRRFIRASSLKKEPLDNDFRSYTATMTAEWTNTTQYARFQSATAAGQLATLVTTFDGPIAHAGATLPRLEVTIEEGAVDVEAPIEGPDTIRQNITVTAFYDGTNAACKATYRTTDVTP